LSKHEHPTFITELLVGLDYERGGDIARSLNRLYNRDYALDKGSFLC